MAYALGAVKPWVKKAADEVGTRFGVSTIYGVGAREIANSDHPKGLALDFMVGSDLSKGDSIANYLQQNASHYSVTYIIWKQHIWNIARASEGWRAMSDRGGITANHYDHVHVSFAVRAGASNASLINPPNLPGIIPGIPNPLDPLKDVAKLAAFVTDTHNWLRVGMFTLGGLLILVSFALFNQANGLAGKPSDIANLIGKASKTKVVKNA